MSDKPIAEKPSSPITVNRKQTITIEASQKSSISKTNSEYETILSQPIEINNNDVIQISSVYCDTTGIDPTKIRIEEDVEITWENGSYLINQQTETVVPSAVRNPGQFITDNLPYTFCEYTAEGTTNFSHYTQARCRSTYVRTPYWGNMYFNIQYVNVSGSTVRKRVYVPKAHTPMWPAGAKYGSVVYDIDIVADNRYPPVAINPDTGAVSDDWGIGGGGGFVQIPIDGPLVSTPITSGLFQPVINRGKMTISAGDYTPAYLAKLITDGFSYLNTSDLRTSIVRPTGKYIIDGILTQVGNQAVAPGNGTVVITDTEWPNLPYPFVDVDKYIGWTLVVRYETGTTPPYGQMEHTILGGGILNQFVMDGSWPVIPTTGAMRYHLIPPSDFYDKGSKFLQTTANYSATVLTGEKAYAFVDCSQDTPNNILTFEDRSMPFGTTQTELLWDDDLKRFKFNYLHYPLTSSKDHAPALIIQKNLVCALNSNGDKQYVNDYAKGSVNQISTSYGGCFFTSLEPRSLFETIMGFNYTDKSIEATVGQSTITTNSYINGLPVGGGTAQGYTSVVTPRVDLIYGQNITRQSATISDVVGEPLDYTTYTAVGVASPATPGAGRVLIERTQVQAIFAESNGNQIGVQDSGYFVVEIELGIQYNMSVGSSTKPTAFTRNIRAIINRYYSVNSYTSSGGSNTEYIHYGNSSVITSVKVRLRNSDGSVIKHIGNDNTVFLNILKNNQATIV